MNHEQKRMVNVVLVDDEQSGIRMLQRCLEEYPEAEIAGAYTDSLVALEEIERIKPGVAFLDIQMPNLKGVEAAAIINETSPNTQVVFVTAYDSYAVEAFELGAVDYLMKPVSKQRFAQTFQRVLSRIELRKTEDERLSEPKRRLKITTLGDFSIAWTDAPPLKWRAKKTRELAAFLVYNAGRQLSKNRILETLWPSYAPETASAQLYKNIHYIRKALEEYGIEESLMKLEGKYLLSIGTEVEQDFLIFGKAEEALFSGRNGTDLETAEHLYTGEFMAGVDGTWAITERERLNGAYIDIALELASLYRKQFQPGQAEGVLLKAFNAIPGEDRIVEALLTLYKDRQEKTKSAAIFSLYSEYLDKELGVTPPERILKLLS